MYLHGEFLSKRGQTIAVYILTNQDSSTEIEIGVTTSDIGEVLVYFDGEDAVEIESSVNDTFDHILAHSATIRLQLRAHLDDLFCANPKDAVVNVYRDGVCLFAGFVEPMTYSQDYNEVYDVLELSCIDVLSALQYRNYQGVSSSDSYTLAKADISTTTFYAILKDVLDGWTDGLDILTSVSELPIYYDESKAYASTSAAKAFLRMLYISTELFFGDDDGDTWTEEDVVTEILKYCNLHITQIGLAFYIFDWRTIKNGGTVTWCELNEMEETTQDAATYTLVSKKDSDGQLLVADCNTNISINEIYNRIEVTVSIESVDNLFESPLDEDDITSPFSKRQKMMTEILHPGHVYSVGTRYMHWMDMILEGDCSCSAGIFRDWYYKVLSHPNWQFNLTIDGTRKEDIISYYCSSGTSQHTIPQLLPTGLGACLIQYGSVETYTKITDNTVKTPSMTTALVITVNGNGDEDEDSYYPTDDDIYASYPVASYTGTTSVSLTPVDESVTNYIVFSGSITLVPRWPSLARYADLYALGSDYSYKDILSLMAAYLGEDSTEYKNACLTGTGDDDSGRWLLTRHTWQASSPTDTPTSGTTSTIFYPSTDEMPTDKEFTYSAIGDDTDTISKVSVVACMLRVGSKVCVETGTDGAVTDFSWQTYKTLDECEDEDEYFEQCIFLGFNPAIGDELIGTQFDIANNVTADLGLDVEGMAIPITIDDDVSGEVQFDILGVVNVWWDEVTRRHKTWFRHTKWTSTSVPLMASVSSIIISGFECEIVSDNGGVEVDEDNDLVYYSDTDEDFLNIKDDIEMKINSALTSDECNAYGVASTVNISTPLNGAKGSGITAIYDEHLATSAKPEQLYVDAYYKEYHEKRIEMEQNIEDDAEVDILSHIVHPAMSDKEFFIEGISRNLDEGTAKLLIKEIDTEEE